MQCDGFTLSKIIYELNSFLIGGKVNKITQHEKDSLLIFIYNQTGTSKLLLSCNAEHPRIHTTSHSFDNPMTPPAFCMTLRKHLIGSKIVKIEQENMDRVVKIIFSGFNEMQDMEEKFLYIEIMGKHSNIILTNNNNTILCANKTTFLDTQSVRKIFAGIKYRSPETQEKIYILEKQKITDALQNVSEGIESALQKNIYGISKILAKEVAFEHNGNTQKIIDKLQEFYNKKPKPIISDKYFLPFKYATIEDIFVAMDTMNQAIDEFYYESSRRKYFLDKSKNLICALKTQISRTQKKLAKTQENIQNSYDYEKYKLYGELITANIYKLKTGDKVLSTQNYYAKNSEDIQIQLDPILSPAKNAQKYYKKYTKNKKTFEMNTQSLEQIKNQIEYLQSIEQSFNLCSDASELNDIKCELIQAGIIKEEKTKVKQTNVKTSIPNEIDFMGYKIIVGKNNIQNDIITKQAKSNDMWLHVLKEHGSHVIIKNPSEQSIPEEVIQFAARKAKEFSTAKNAGKTCVDYTFKKFVKKPPKANLGMVTYTNQKTIIIE